MTKRPTEIMATSQSAHTLSNKLISVLKDSSFLELTFYVDRHIRSIYYVQNTYAVGSHLIRPSGTQDLQVVLSYRQSYT